jgi:hypothetical protein
MAGWGNDYYDEEPEPPPIGDILFGNDMVVDERAQELFIEAFFEGGNDEAYQELVDFIWDEYGIDFEDAFQWEDFREWYG